jgi:hypothetical protein
MLARPDVSEVPCGGLGDPMDVDTPEDLRAVEVGSGGGPDSTERETARRTPDGRKFASTSFHIVLAASH